MTQLILVRHGATQASLSGVYCGRTDLPLARGGEAAIKRTARMLTGLKPDCVCCSDMLRARQTARILVPAVKPVFLDSLREMDFGEFEGLGAGEIQSRLPDAWQAFLDGWESFAFPGGGSVPAYLKKAAGTIDTIIDNHPGRCVLIVSHKGFILSALSHLLHGDTGHIFQYDIRPAGLARIDIENGFAVLKQLI